MLKISIYIFFIQGSQIFLNVLDVVQKQIKLRLKNMYFTYSYIDSPTVYNPSFLLPSIYYGHLANPTLLTGRIVGYPSFFNDPLCVYSH